MAVGGLVLTLHPDPQREREVLRQIAADPRLEQGPRTGSRLALVVTTDSLGEGHALCEALLAHPGIENLEVAYVAPEEERVHGASDARVNTAPEGGLQEETIDGRQR
jgi:hypothetical protein